MEHKINILKVWERSNNKLLDAEKISIKLHISQSSNTKKEVYRIFYDNDVIKKNNNYMTEYECIKCKRHNIVTLNNIARKFNKNMLQCKTCANEEDGKREKQSIFMKENFKNVFDGVYEKPKVQKKVNLLDKLNSDMISFNNMDEEFKKAYFEKHLTLEEFERIKHKIISFQSGKFTNISEFLYYPCVSICNQTKFNPYLYNKEHGVIEKISYIRFCCEACGENFENRDLYKQKNKFKILCSGCNFTNNIFKIRTCCNSNNEQICYQSKLEKKLVDLCNEHNVVIRNGPKVPYNFNGKNHIYKVDFEIPSLHLLIECKDNHIWHKKNLESGKWQAKENACRKFVESSSNYNKFIMIFPKTFKELTNEILKLSNKI